MSRYPVGGHDAADPWRHPDDAAGSSGGDTNSFADMIVDYYSTDDLFELAWEQQGGEAGGASASTTAPPPPSEDEMAAWLRAIVKGEELVSGDEQPEQDVAAPKGSSEASTTEEKEKLSVTMTEGTMIGTEQEMVRKPPARGSSRSSHHGEAHNLTEKRRRHKINERLRTLQQLVPGCDKSNQASTLDQTIQYMKSLQHHVQAMSVGPARPAAPYPAVVEPPVTPAIAVPMPPAAPMVLAPVPTMMVPFGAMLHLPGHYPAAGVHVMMPAAAAAPLPLYPPAVPPRTAPPPSGGGAGRRPAIGKARAAAKGREVAGASGARNTELALQY